MQPNCRIATDALIQLKVCAGRHRQPTGADYVFSGSQPKFPTGATKWWKSQAFEGPGVRGARRSTRQQMVALFIAVGYRTF
jgi:hypothetical protein